MPYDISFISAVPSYFVKPYVVFSEMCIFAECKPKCMKIALIGYGRMGRMIEQTARERGHEIVCIIDVGDQEKFDNEAFRSADAAIEFTIPTAAYKNVRQAMERGVPVVSGTTGWYKEHIQDIQHLTDAGGTFLWASNFSLGVGIFRALNRQLARIMSRFPQYVPTLEEIHHVHKLDAPSGTAITLAEDIVTSGGRAKHWILGHVVDCDGNPFPGSTQRVDSTTISPDSLIVNAVREGEVPGIHTITFRSEADEIQITHSAHNRSGFALGAVLAAEYAATHTGLLHIDDMFDF